MNESGDGNIFKVPKLQSSNSNRGDIVLTRPDETNNRGDIVLTRPDETNTQERNQAKNAKKSNAMAVTYESLCAVEEEDAGETVGNHAIDELKETTELEKWELEEMGETENATNLKTKSSLQETREDCFTGIKETVVKQKLVETAVNDTETKMECQISVELKECTEVKIDNSENVALSNEQENINAAGEDACRKPVLIEETDVIQSPILKEAQRLYDLVKDINKTFDQPEKKEWLEDNFQVEYEKKSDSTARTCKKELYSSDVEMEEKKTSHSIAVQTSPHQSLHIDSVEVDESVQSSQSSATESEISEGNCSQESSAMETDGSAVSEAQTVVLELYQTDNDNNDVTYDDLQCAIRSETLEKRIEIQCDETHDEIDLSNTVSETSAMTVEGDSTKMLNATITDSIVYSKPQLEEADGSKDTSDKKTEKLTRSETIRKDKSELEMLDDNAESLCSASTDIIAVSEESSITANENKEPDTSDKIILVASDSVEYDIESDEGSDLEDVSEIEEEIVDRADNSYLKEPGQKEEEFNKCVVEDNSKEGQEFATIKQAGHVEYQKSVQVPIDTSIPSACIILDSFENKETHLSVDVAAESISEESSNKSEKRVEMINHEGFVDELKEKRNQSEEHLSENGNQSDVMEDARTGMNLEIISVAKEVISVSEESSVTVSENKDQDNSDKIELIALDSVEYAVVSNVGIDLEDASEIEEEIVDGTDRLDNKDLKVPEQNEEELSEILTMQDDSKIGQEVITFEKTDCTVVSESNQESVNVPTDMSSQSPCISIDSFENEETPLSHAIAAESYSRESSYKSEKQVEMYIEGFVDELNEKQDQNEEQLSENGQTDLIEEDACSGMNLENISVAKEVISVSEESSITEIENKELVTSDKINPLASDSVEYNVESDVEINVEDVSEIGDETVDCIDRFDNGFFKYQKKKEDELSKMSRQSNSKEGREIFTYKKRDSGVKIYHTGVKYYQSGVKFYYAQIPIDRSSPSPSVSIDSLQNKDTSLSIEITDESSREEGNNKAEKEVEMINDDESVVIERSEKQAEDEIDNIHLSDNNDQSDLMEDACAAMTSENISVDSGDSDVASFENTSLMLSETVRYPVEQTDGEDNSDIAEVIEEMQEVKDDSINDTACKLNDEDFVHERDIRDSMKNMQPVVNCTETNEKKHLPYMEEEMVPDEENAYKWDSKQNQTECDLRMILSNKNDNDSRAKHDLSGKNITEENLLTVDKLDRLKLTQCENSMTSESAEADSVASNTSNQVDFIEPTTADDIPVKSGLEENVSDDNNKDQLLNKCIDDKHVAESENVESDSGKCSATVDLCDSVNLLKKEDNVFLESLKYNIESKGQCGIEQRTEMLEEMPRSEIHAKDSESAFYLINATFESNGEMISSCEREMSPHDFENNEKVKINSRIENFVDTVEVSMNRNTDVGMSVRSDDDCMDHEDDNHTDQNCEIQMAAEIIERTAILKEENIEANSDIKLIENSNCLELHMSEGKSNENEADGALRQGLSVVEKCSELTPVNDRSAQVSVAILEDQHAVDKMDQVSLVSLEDAKQTDSSIDHNEDPEVAYETTVHSKNLDSDMNNVETDKNVDQMEHLSDKDQSIKQVENIEVNEKDELIGNKKASEKEVFTKEASENSDATGHPPDIIGEPKTDEQNIVKTQDKATNHADFGPVQNEEDTNDVRRDGKAEIEPGFKNYPLTFKTIVPSPGTLEMTMCTESNFLGKVDQLAQNIDKAVDNDSNKPDIEMENQNFVAEQNGVTATVLSVMQPSYHCQYQPKEPESETCEKIYDKLLVFGPGRGYDYKLTCTHEEENFEFNSPVRGTEFIEHIPISTDEGRSKLNGEDSFEVSYSENCMPVETGLEVIAFSQCVTDFNKTPNELKNIAAESTEDENLSDMCKESVAFESVSDKKVSESCRIPNDEDIVGLVHETTEEIVDKCEGHGLDYKSSDVQPNVPVMEFNGSGINHSLWSNGSKMDVSEDDIRRGTKNRKRKLSNSDELSELPVKRICNNEGDGNNGLSTGNVERRKKIKNERAAELKKHVMMFLKFRKKYEKSKSSKSFDKRDAELKTNMRTFFKFREKFEKLKSKASQMIRQDTIERQVKRFFKRWSLKKKYCEIHTQSTNTESSQSDTDIDMASTEKSDQVSVPMEFKDCEVPEKTEAKLAQFVESENSIVEETVKVNEIIRENDRVVFAKENGIEIMLSDTGCTIQNTSSETMYVETLPHNDNESLPNVCERTSDMNNMILEQKDYHEERQVKTEVVENVIIEKSGIGKSDLGMLFDAESAVSDGTSADKNEKTQDSQMSDAAEKSKYTQADTRLSSDISMNLVACSPDNDIDAGCGFMPNHMKGNELNKVNSEFDTSKTDVNCIAQATDEIETIRVSEHEHEKENGSLDSSCTHTNENISESTTDRTIKHNEDMKSVNSIEEHALNANISDNTLSNMKASDSTGELVNVENECQKDNDDAKSDVEKSETITPDEDSEEEDMEDLKDDGDDVDDNDDDNNDGCGGNNAGSENEEGQENERSSYGENDSNGNDDSNQGNETEINMDDEVDADEQVHEDEKRTYDDNDGNDENELPFENKTEKGGEADSEVKALDNVLETGGQNKESDDYPIVSEYKAIDSTNIENNQTQNSPSNTPEPEKNVNMSFQKNLPKQIEPLSCQFSDSDDDNEDFVSPIIQMPCLDDDSNSEDDIQCGQREVQISIANEKTDSESHAGVSSDGDIQCGQRQAYISIADEKIDSDPQAGVRSDWDIQCGQRKAQYIIADDLIDSDSQAGVSSDEKENTLNCIDKQEVMIYTDSDSDVEDSENESTEDLKHDDDDDNDDDDDDDNDDDDDEMSQIIQNPAGDDDTEFSPDLDLQFQDNGNDNDEDSNGSQNIESNERDDAESDNEWLPFPEDNNSLTAASDHDDRDDWDSVSLDKGDSRDYEKEDVQNVEDEMESSDTDLDTDVDGKEENYRHITYDRVRTPSKRKRDFEDEELMSPKIARCDSKRMSSARSIGMSEEAKNTFKSPNIPAPSRRKHNSHTADSEMECHSPHAFSSTQMLSSSQQPDLDDLSLSQMTTVAKQLEVKAQDKSQSTTTNRRARELLAMLKAKKEVIETTGLDNEDNVDVLPLSQEGPSTIQSGRSEAEIALMKDEEHIKRYVGKICRPKSCVVYEN